MTKKEQSSRTILQVERAASDLRRGQAIILEQDGKKYIVKAGEYEQQQTPNADKPLAEAMQPAWQVSAIKLLKIAGLLPQAIIEDYYPNQDLLTVSGEDINNYPFALASSLEKISEARVPLKLTENSRVIAFRPRFGHDEHLAIIIGEIGESCFVRIHSSCITGDVLGSLRCDCGNQLQKGLEIIAKQGSGVIIYLNQEGRGIGIANKLRAYCLQDEGLDTVEANEALGFAPDERDFALAAEILRQIGVTQVTLITNNPTKIKALEFYGIKILNRESVITAINPHNKDYMETKANKMGHNLE